MLFRSGGGGVGGGGRGNISDIYNYIDVHTVSHVGTLHVSYMQHDIVQVRVHTWFKGDSFEHSSGEVAIFLGD